MRKATACAYEAEWRVMKAGHLGLGRLDAAAITGVILGGAGSAANEAHVREPLSRRRRPVELLRARIDRERYLVRIEPA